MKIKYLILYLIFGLLLAKFELCAQCCSSGNPISASTHVGILDTRTLRTTVFFRHSFSDDYFRGTTRLNNYPNAVKYSEFDFFNLALAYGVLPRLTVETDLGYFSKKMQHLEDSIDGKLEKRNLSGKGFSSGSVMLKYCFLHERTSGLELTVGGGIKVPFSTQAQYRNNVVLPQDIQPSTGAFGFLAQVFVHKRFPAIGLRSFVLARFERNGANYNDYTYGPLFYISWFAAREIVPKLNGIVQIRFENRGTDQIAGTKFTNSGSKLLYVAPQMSYSFANDWHVSVVADWPVYKNYDGIQLSSKYSLAFSLSHDFKL